MTAKSPVMKTGKTRPGATVEGLISAWMWPFVILEFLRARMVIQRTPFMAISPLLLVHTVISSQELKLILKNHNHLVLNLTSLNNNSKGKYVLA